MPIDRDVELFTYGAMALDAVLGHINQEHPAEILRDSAQPHCPINQEHSAEILRDNARPHLRRQIW